MYLSRLNCFDLAIRSRTSSLDLTGIGSTFDNIPFRSRDRIYRMPKELAFPRSPPTPSYAPPNCIQANLLILHSSVTAVKSSTKTSNHPSLSGSPPLKPRKQDQLKLSENENCLLGEKRNVFGVDLRDYLETQRGKSVYEKFMREEGLNEKLWRLGQEKVKEGGLDDL